MTLDSKTNHEAPVSAQHNHVKAAEHCDAASVAH